MGTEGQATTAEEDESIAQYLLKLKNTKSLNKARIEEEELDP